jgi:hypothetical protein
MENMAYMLISIATKIQSLPPSLNKSKHQQSLIGTFIHMFIMFKYHFTNSEITRKFFEMIQIQPMTTYYVFHDI